jgi:tRNA dimethylallyltransferase
LERGRVPIVVGGTYLYLQALLYGLAETPEPDWKLRNKLYSIAQKSGGEFLYRKLSVIDPLYAGKIHPNDLRRIVRALEVFIQSGRRFSEFHNWTKPKIPFIGFYLRWSKEALMERIERRVLKMFEEGLVEEVKGLMEMGLEGFLTSSQAIGYKELIPYIKGDITLEEAMERVIRNTKAYAKRQIRWARRMGFLEVDMENMSMSEGVGFVLNHLSYRGIL